MVHSQNTRIDHPSVRQLTMESARLTGASTTCARCWRWTLPTLWKKSRFRALFSQKLSFLGRFIKVLAGAVSRHPPVNSIRRGRQQVITFRSGNFATVVEKKVYDTAVPLPLLLRDINHRSLEDIEREIHLAVSQVVSGAGNFVLGEGFSPLLYN